MPTTYQTFEKLKALHPFDEAGLISKLFHSWPSHLIALGNTRQLEPQDLWSLQPCNKVDTTSVIFETQYQQSNKSILGAFFAIYWKQFLQLGLMELYGVACDLYGPIVLGLVLDGLEEELIDFKLLLFYVGSLFFAHITRAIVRTHLNLQNSIIGVQFTSALRHMLFEKSLVLSISSKKEKSSGDIVNLFSVDVWNILDFGLNVHQMWIVPLQISIVIYLLYKTIGNAIFAGTGVVFLILIINAILAMLFSREQETLMKWKDDRMRILSEMFGAIQIVKFNAWEEQFLEKIYALRRHEVASLWRFFRYIFIMVMFLTCTPLLVTLAVFGTFTLWMHATLSVKTAFSALALFKTLQDPLLSLPSVVMALVQSLVSSKRINELLLMEEIDPTNVVTVSDRSAQKYIKDHTVIAIEHGTFGWDAVTKLFENINISVKKGELIVVHGGVGEGKTSFLSILLGELVKSKGNVFVGGEIAYVSQQPWIQNMTIRENILFGKPYDRSRYQKVLEATALVEDLNSFPAGDCTEIGQRGINLSGGQKARISLARACYSDADIQLLDAPLAALDTIVQKYVYEKCIVGFLQHKTVVLVTYTEDIIHSKYIDQSIFIQDGQVTTTLNPVKEKRPKLPLSPKKSPLTNRLAYWEKEKDGQEKSPLPGYMSKRIFQPPPKRRVSFNQLVVDEDRAEGRVSNQVIFDYLQAGGGIPAVLLILLFTTGVQMSRVAADFWLAQWTNEGDTIADSTVVYNMYIYSIFAGVNLLLVLLQVVCVVASANRASNKYFDQALSCIVQAPLQYFDVNPVGRLLNRFSDDVSACDFQIPFSLGPMLGELSSVLFTVLTTIYVVRWFGLGMLPLLYLYLSLGSYFLRPLREVQRIQKISRAPVLSHVSECIDGSITIRAYGLKNIRRIHQLHHTKIDEYGKAHFAYAAVNQWFSLRIQLLSSLIVLTILLALVYLHAKLSPAIVGLVFTYGLTIPGNLEYLINIWSSLETAMIAPERLYAYIHVEKEGARELHEMTTSAWPETGEVKFKNVSYRYKEKDELVLQDVSFDVASGERIGIVGRTGAGKSSLIQALFRMNEVVSGEILISGVNISQIGTKLLRRSIAIVPQNPVLFRGTLRANLDPFNEFAEDALWNALRKVQLHDYISEMNGKLDLVVDENGENFSVGERQMLCLARALLKQSKVVVMDEATAAIDHKTDHDLQRVIREEFALSTVLTIAHRLDSVLDSDRIMVLDHGQLIQYDSPQQLLSKGSGIFYDLAVEGGYVNASKN